jgi:AraC-like DNA-binding protein
MEYIEIRPQAPLASLIHCFWFLRGPLAAEPPQAVVPDGRIELVFHLGEPFAELDEHRRVRQQAAALAAGQLTKPIYLAPRGPADVVGIRFRTTGAAAVLPMPLRHLTGRVETLAHLAPALAARLFDAAARGREPMARAASLGETLGRLVRRQPDPVTVGVVRVLQAARAPRLSELACRLQMTPRTLERRLLDDVGLTPKVLQRILRFRRAIRVLGGTPRGQWARAALALGYFDQAHLIRDFKGFAGAPPSTFFGGDPTLARVFVGAEEPSR